MGKARSIDEIRADLARNRVRVADSVGEAAAAANPKRIVKDSVETAKGIVTDEFNSAKAQFVDENGLRMKRVLIVGGIVLGLVATTVTLSIINGQRDKEIEKRLRKAIEARA